MGELQVSTLCHLQASLYTLNTGHRFITVSPFTIKWIHFYILTSIILIQLVLCAFYCYNSEIRGQNLKPYYQLNIIENGCIALLLLLAVVH
jgi:hypothetical protein